MMNDDLNYRLVSFDIYYSLVAEVYHPKLVLHSNVVLELRPGQEVDTLSFAILYLIHRWSLLCKANEGKKLHEHDGSYSEKVWQATHCHVGYYSSDE